ncbi:MAG: glycosyltransferase family 2 protein [Gallionella sp.]|nr:glycosyltransferase family 2 protein [Gallionella sp.]
MLERKALSIIIVNWNAGIQLAVVVNSISQYHQGLVSSVVIVDNASTDDSLAQVEMLQNLPFKLQIVRNTDNCGFGVACNRGAALAKSEFVLFLNPDTRLFENSLPVPLAFMQKPINQNVGVVGIQLIDEQSCIAHSCARFPSLGMFAAQAIGFNRLPRLRHLNMHMTDWEHNETRAVDHVIGAYYLMRHSIFETLGGFDERYFVYLEDLDLSLRAHQSGYQSVYLADAQAFHAGGGTSRQVKTQRLFYSLRSRLLFGFKHFPKHQAWLLLLITYIIEPWSRLLFTLAKGSWRDAVHTLQAYVLLIRSLPEVLLLSRR